ncbi:hypothetical protein [Roseivirga spongicola]|uniref:hypothetical protein n=1 Tax=Roseivirga spongicola TaxID=333140 RepID=UPI002AC9E500|nr:hypothetical protein [Roseivirga spongicola]WPZ08740.1 hypothetical protein T7867_10770 [Roseivirga spongicola]
MNLNNIKKQLRKLTEQVESIESKKHTPTSDELFNNPSAYISLSCALNYSAIILTDMSGQSSRQPNKVYIRVKSGFSLREEQKKALKIFYKSMTKNTEVIIEDAR